MDFLAELATSEQSHWEQPLPIDRVVNVLNYREQENLIKGGEDLPEGARPILLTLITGKDNLFSTVTLKKGKGNLISCPSGEVGVHALYVILENIIRNSARHNSNNQVQQNSQVELEVNLSDDTSEIEKLDGSIDASQYFMMTIVDTSTTSTQKNNELVANLNKIFELTSSGFLDGDNNLETQNWGLREMQICAHYLRGIPLTELEGPQQKVITATCKNGNLAYRILLKKGKILAYVQEENSEENSEEVPQGCRKIIIASSDKMTDADWTNIAKQAQGYSFLWLPEKQFKAANNGFRHKLPVRLVTGKCCELEKTLIEIEIESKTDTKILHKKVLEQYRNNGCDKSKIWGNRPIELILSPASPSGKNPIEIPQGVTLKEENDDSDNPLTECDYLEQPENERCETPVKLGLIDHPNDSRLWDPQDNFRKHRLAACLPELRAFNNCGRR